MQLDQANMALQPYGKEWRMTRRIADHSLRPSASVTYQPMQKIYTHRFLRQLLKEPRDFPQYIRQSVLLNMASSKKEKCLWM